MRYYLTSIVASSAIYALAVAVSTRDLSVVGIFFFLGLCFGALSSVLNALILRSVARKFSLAKMWQWVLIGTLIPIVAVVTGLMFPVSIWFLFPIAFGPILLLGIGGPWSLLVVSAGTSLALYYADKAKSATSTLS